MPGLIVQYILKKVRDNRVYQQDPLTARHGWIVLPERLVCGHIDMVLAHGQSPTKI